MAKRKQEDYEERRSQILAGALEVFARKGFAQTTNKDIAVAAGIKSPGLIYHYFKDKADLMREVVDRYMPPMQVLSHTEEMMALPPTEALTRLGLAYIRITEEPGVSAAFRLILSEVLRDPKFALLVGEIGPLRILGFLAEYLRHQMDNNILRRIDPQAAARCFVGPLIAHIFIHTIFQFTEERAMDAATLVKSNVDVFLNGMKPGDEPSSEVEPAP